MHMYYTRRLEALSTVASERIRWWHKRRIAAPASERARNHLAARPAPCVVLVQAGVVAAGRGARAAKQHDAQVEVGRHHEAAEAVGARGAVGDARPLACQTPIGDQG
jgi:hypothetical protein